MATRAGLTAEEVAERIATGRVNTTDLKGGRSITQILRANVLTRFNAILGSLLVVIVFVGPFQDGLFGVVLAVNTVIGVAQELTSEADARSSGGAHGSDRPRDTGRTLGRTAGRSTWCWTMCSSFGPATRSSWTAWSLPPMGSRSMSRS